MPSDWARRCAEAIRGGGRSEYLRYALLPRVFTIPGASSLARMKDTVGAWYEGSPHPQLSIRDVQPVGPAFMSVEMALEIWKWRLSWTSSISSRSVGNDFQQPLGNEGSDHFQMSSISTPTGDRPTLNVAGRPRP